MTILDYNLVAWYCSAHWFLTQWGIGSRTQLSDGKIIHCFFSSGPDHPEVTFIVGGVWLDWTVKLSAWIYFNTAHSFLLWRRDLIVACHWDASSIIDHNLAFLNFVLRGARFLSEFLTKPFHLWWNRRHLFSLILIRWHFRRTFQLHFAALIFILRLQVDLTLFLLDDCVWHDLSHFRNSWFLFRDSLLWASLHFIVRSRSFGLSEMLWKLRWTWFLLNLRRLSSFFGLAF